MKIHPVGAVYFHADSQTEWTDVTKLIVALRSFANVPKNHPLTHKWV